jgi:hypothetical protein
VHFTFRYYIKDLLYFKVKLWLWTPMPKIKGEYNSVNLRGNWFTYSAFIYVDPVRNSSMPLRQLRTLWQREMVG